VLLETFAEAGIVDEVTRNRLGLETLLPLMGALTSTWRVVRSTRIGDLADSGWMTSTGAMPLVGSCCRRWIQAVCCRSTVRSPNVATGGMRTELPLGATRVNLVGHVPS
jgi:hypothetical protein